VNAQERKNDEESIGFVTIVMSDTGPQIAVNDSTLPEVAGMYLAVKGFTAIMAGFERNQLGPGRIRGILQIPTTNQFGILFDQTMKGSGAEQDERLQKSRQAIISIIATEMDLAIIRKHYTETEHFLQKELENILSINQLDDKFVKELRNKYIEFLQQIQEQKGKSKGTTSEEETKRSLFDMTILLDLPKDENITARAIMEYMSDNNQGATLEDISELTSHWKRKVRKSLRKLVEKGLVIIVPSHEDEEQLRYIAK
jgi:hypothetical protein